MNNMKRISVIFLLSAMTAGYNYADNTCNTGCNTSSSSDCSSSSCGTSSSDCGTSSSDCSNKCATSTFFRPEQYTTDLTYRNNQTFFERYHDARCNMFTFDSTVFFQKSRNSHIAEGFLGKNPVKVAEVNGDIYSVNLGLGSLTNPPTNFESVYGLCPERRVIGWLAQGIFNLDCFYQGLWFDFSFAVVQARHKLNQNEKVVVKGDIVGQPTTVTEALALKKTFAGNGNSCFEHTGVDDVVLRLGYDFTYGCDEMDHFGLYFMGIAPTGKNFDNSKWFQPITGSKHGAVGFGVEGDYTICSNDANGTEFTVATEIMYQFRLKHSENRIFDLKNGTGSRWLLAVAAPGTGQDLVSITDKLTQCVSVEGRHNVQWWLNFHYQWCNWGGELSYNLNFRDCERIKCANFDFKNLGIFDNTKCGEAGNPRTSHSTALISDGFKVGTDDKTFVALTSDNVNLGSGAARRVLTHKFAGNFSYSNIWCECYPFSVALGAGYLFASKEYRRHALESWNVFAKWSMSF